MNKKAYEALYGCAVPKTGNKSKSLDLGKFGRTKGDVTVAVEKNTNDTLPKTGVKAQKLTR